MPFVISQAAMMDSARPSHPVWSSHSFRFHISDFGVPRGTVAPGTNINEMMAIKMMGVMVQHTTKSQTGTVSWTVYGKLLKV